MDNPSAGPAELRTPRAAAVAGIAFALILGTVIVLARSSTLAQGVDPTTWLNPQSRRTSVEVALYLVPFAGIAFLWFIGVLRSRLGAAEDRLFATVFLGSGLLFVASLFVATAALSAILQLAPPGGAVPTESVKLLATFSAVFSGGIRDQNGRGLHVGGHDGGPPGETPAWMARSHRLRLPSCAADQP